MSAIVLRLIADGKTNKEIGVDLYISKKTVDSHVANIFGKINVANRAEAVTFAARNGIIAKRLQQ